MLQTMSKSILQMENDSMPFLENFPVFFPLFEIYPVKILSQSIGEASFDKMK